MKKLMLTTFVVIAAGLGACDDDPTGPQEERFTATLTGSAERPTPVTTNAQGTAEVIYNPDTGTFSYTLNVSGFTTAIVGAHIHGPATTEEPAGVIVPLTTPAGAVTIGTFTGTNQATISVDSLLSLLRNRRAYVNVHSSAHPPGEIRGQLGPD